MALCIIEYKKDLYATGGCDTKIRLWSGYEEGLDYEGELNGHRMDVNCMCFINGNTLVSGSDDNDLRAWNIEEYDCSHVFKEHLGDVRDVVGISDKCIASASYDKTVRIFDLEKVAQKQVLRGHISRVRCVEYNREHGVIFSGSYGRRVFVWAENTGKPVVSVKENNWINSLHYFHPKGYLITGDDQGKLGWWDLRKMQHAVRHDHIHENFVTGIITLMAGLFANEVNQLATCSTDGKICVVDANDGKILRTMEEKGWVFGLINHERTLPNKLQQSEDIEDRTYYLHRIGGFELKIKKPGRTDKYRTIRINRMLLTTLVS